MLSSVTARVKNFPISKAEVAFLLFLLVLGIPMIVLIPPGAGYDEEDHLVRVWELSAFSFIPGQMSPQEMRYPTLFRDFAYRQQGSTGVIDSEFWKKYGRASLYESGFVRREIDTKSVYSPALLLPQALTLRLLGRSLNLPALPVFYVCRFASLLSYLLLVWLAIRWIPFGKWILLVLAVSPMALFQATTVSPDAISNGIGFLFIAGCLRAAEGKEIGWRKFGTLALLIFLLFLAKLNLVPLILLPFLVLPPSRFTRKGMYPLLLGLTAILFLVEVAGWNAIAMRHMDSLLANEANPTAQLLYLAGHPLAFLQTLLKDLVTNGSVYIQGWINGYGYYYWTPPAIVSLFFLLSLGTVLLSDSVLEQTNKQLRIAFLLVFAAGYLATVASLYLTFTPVGSDQIFGVQGRYFIPLALLLMLTLAGTPWMKKIARASSKWAVLFLTLTLSLNLLALFLSFYVPCGSTFYRMELCYRPFFRGFSSETHASPPIAADRSLTQEIQVTCDGFAEMRLLTLPAAPGDQGITHFVLQDPSNQILLDTSVANNQITQEDWYPLHFQPDWQSAGKQYALKISSTNTSGGQGLRLLYSPESAFSGNLFENGIPSHENIVLQYGCATGLLKIWSTDPFLKP